MKKLQQGIRVRHGTEGPRHDPYSFVEITVTRLNGTVIVGHFGLLNWIKVNEKEFPFRYISGDWDEPSNAAQRAFERESGISFHRAMRIVDELRVYQNKVS